MVARAFRAMVLNTTQLTREASCSTKALGNVWNGLIRPHLEYGAEVIDEPRSGIWPEAESIQSRMGRKILRCGGSVTTEALRGDLGWETMRGRRIARRLVWWGKLVKMPPDRWARKIYEFEREQCRRLPATRNWCSYTRDLLIQTRLTECWRRQRPVKANEMGREAKVVTEVSMISGNVETTVYPPHRTEWRTVVWKAVHVHEQREWRRAMEARPKLDLYRQLKTVLKREEYLSSPDVIGRTTLFSLRSGTNKLRIDTGRNERVLDVVTGKRRRLERKERICRQCGTGTEDEIHVLLYCPMYVPIRRELIHDLKKDSPADDTGLVMFLTGLCHAANVQWDRMEAEKTLILMMGKKRILQTMAVAKRIMQRRQAIIREQEGETDTESDEEPVKPKPVRRVGRKGTNEVRSVRRRNNPPAQATG